MKNLHNLVYLGKLMQEILAEIENAQSAADLAPAALALKLGWQIQVPLDGLLGYVETLISAEEDFRKKVAQDIRDDEDIEVNAAHEKRMQLKNKISLAHPSIRAN